MLPKFRIRNPDTIVNTKMEIRRSTSMATVAASTPIFSGAYAAEYLDTTVPANGRYVYLISLGSDQVGMIPQIPFWYNYRSEWGPWDMNLGIQQGVNHCATAARGNMFTGVMFDVTGMTLPVYADVTNWSTLVSTGTGLAIGEVKALTSSAVLWNTTYKGRIVRYPGSTENQAQLTTTAIAADRAAKALNELTTRLNDPSNTANIYTVSGYKYALRVMDRTMYEDLKSTWIMGLGYTPSCAKGIDYTFTNMYVAKDDTTLTKISNTGVMSETDVSTGTIIVSPLVYFEYIGPA